MKHSRHSQGGISFLGAGVYDHFCPSLINQLTLRAEFLTSYTPYQPEMSQGTLQALFEFQSMVAELFGMPLSNGSHYDGSTATTEAVLMAARIHPNKKRVVVSAGLHPQYLDVIKTYLTNLGLELSIAPLNESGVTDEKQLAAQLGPDVACFVAQSPNFFGCIEPQETLAGLTQKAGGLFVTAVTEPLSLGILKPPGEYGADIATGEGQSLGLPLSYGGPYVGLFTAKSEYVRQIPGRLCGQSVDAQGKRGFTLTLSTREQHIRREKATSNICTNQNLFALWACIWMSMMGKEGFAELAEQNVARAQKAKDDILSTGKATLRYPKAKFFNEFTVNLKNGSAANFVENAVKKEKIAPGLVLAKSNSADTTGLLICVTEMKSSEDLAKLKSCFEKYA